MAYPTHQQYADLAKDAYENRQVTKYGEKGIPIGGNEYQVLAVANDRFSGYQGTVYLDLKTNAVIVAHRGTESPKKDWKDAVTNLVMVLDRKNGQAQAAVDLTRKAMEEVAKFNEKFPDADPKPTLTHTGHSLGGTLAQISAHYFDQPAVTYNAYGAAFLGRIPSGVGKGGANVTNYVKASDPVAAASGHYGNVVVLATPDDIRRISSSSDPLKVAADSVSTAHTIDNFTGSRSILSDPNAKTLAQQNQAAIASYRNGVAVAAASLGITDNIINPLPNLRESIDMIKPDRPAGEPARKNLPPLAQVRPFDLEMQQYVPVSALSFSDMPKQVQDMCGQCRTLLVEFDSRKGVTRSSSDYDAISLSMATKAYAAGLPEVKFIHVQGDGQINIGYESPQGMFKDTSIQTNQALALSLEDNVLQSKQAERDFALAEEQRAREAEYRAQSYGGRSYG